MRRLFTFLSLAMMIAVGIGGCGGGSEGTSADPLGTDSITFGHKENVDGTEWSMALQVYPGATAVLTAKVKNASGNAVVGRAVAFGFKSNTSGATINVSTASTDGTGEAVIIYHAGPHFGFDTVQASLSNGSKMETNISVGTSGTAGRNIDLDATQTELSANQNSILTATVTNGDGNPVMGQFVTFTYISNLSGGTLTTLNGGITDASGKAIAVHNAGSLTSNVGVQDIVSASIAGAASAAVTITRAASTAFPPPGNRLRLASEASSLTAGQNAVVTATVTSASGAPIGGETVTFTLLSNASGATLTSLSGGVTDAGGNAVAVYTAGANTPAANLQDTIQASVTGSTSALVITRTAAGGGGGGLVGIVVAAVPTSLNAGALSVITATVTNAAGPVAGQIVAFTIVSNNSGATLTTLAGGVTDANGKALATYRAGSTSPAVTVQDVVSATVPSSAGAVILTRFSVAETANRILSFTESPETTAATRLPTTGSNCLLKVRVTRSDLITPVVGETVTFSIFSGAGWLSASTAVTDTQGDAWVNYTGPGGVGPGETVVRATIPGALNGGDAARIIYW